MKTKDIISFAITFVFVIGAIITTGFVIRQQFFPPRAKLDTQKVENWQELERNGWQSGPEDAPVHIIEFFDYECTFCKKVQPVVQGIQRKYTNKVLVSYEHFPLSGVAYEAAIAAECAGKQNSFKPFHDLLFTQQANTIAFDSLAIKAGVSDLTAFKGCLEEEQTASIVQSGLNLAEEIGIDAVPSFMINGQLIEGALTKEQLKELVENALE